MKKITALLLTFCLIFTGCSKMSEVDYSADYSPENQSFQAGDISFAFTADIHYQPVKSDTAALLIKQMEYNDEIIGGLLESCLENGISTLIIGGDLTNSGKLSQHLALAEKLKTAKEKGLQAFVIDGNHDMNQISRQQFRKIYADFGYSQAVSADTESLSYSAVVGDILLLMLGTAIYKESFSAEGKITESQLDWCEKQLIYAAENGLSVITVTHHNLIDGNIPKGYEKTYSTENAQALLELLDKYSVRLNLSGHRHTRRIMQQGKLTEFVSDMPISYPNQYAAFAVESAEKTIKYTPITIDVESWAEKNKTADENLLNFEEYSRKIALEKADYTAQTCLSSAQLTPNERKELTEYFTALYNAYTWGTLGRNPQLFADSPLLEKFKEAAKGSNYVKWLDFWLETANEKTEGFEIKL